jgi:hypothetical protein
VSASFKLDKGELEFAEGFFSGARQLMEEMERCKQFKVGDYLIARYIMEQYKPGVIVESGAYHTPDKFVVVYVNADGIPFYKKLDARGKAVGSIVCCLCENDTISNGSNYYMELDPDYADAIILDSKSEFNPSEVKKRKQELYREITKWNKEAKVDTKDKPALEKFFKTLSAGDILYKSAKNFYTVQNSEMMTRKQAEIKYGYKFRQTSSDIPAVTKLCLVHVVDSKGKAKILCSVLWEMQYSNLYTKRPRTYRELKDN